MANLSDIFNLKFLIEKPPYKIMHIAMKDPFIKTRIQDKVLKCHRTIVD